MSCWYTRKEIGLRVAIFYLANILAQGTSGLIAAAVFATLEGALGMAGWQWIFIVLACVGAALALVCIGPSSRLP
jgi:sugar phosphate permease